MFQRLDPGRLLTALAGVPPEAWSQPSKFADTGVHHGYRRVPLVVAGCRQPHAELFDCVWSEVDVKEANLSSLDPGGFIIPHRDAGPWRERWQLPIVPSGEWHGVDVTPTVGVPFLARHWEPHAVTNRGGTCRIHLVFDTDVAVDREPLPFSTFPIPEDMIDLVDRSRQ